MKCEACRHISPASLGHTKDSLMTDRLLHLQTREALEQVYLATISAWDAVRTCPTFDWPDLLLIAEIITGAQRPLNIIVSCFKFSPVLQLIRAQQYQDVSPLLKSTHGLKKVLFPQEVYRMTGQGQESRGRLGSLTYVQLQAGPFHVCGGTGKQSCTQSEPHTSMWLAWELLAVSEGTKFAKVNNWETTMHR